MLLWDCHFKNDLRYVSQWSSSARKSWKKKLVRKSKWLIMIPVKSIFKWFNFNPRRTYWLSTYRGRGGEYETQRLVPDFKASGQLLVRSSAPRHGFDFWWITSQMMAAESRLAPSCWPSSGVPNGILFVRVRSTWGVDLGWRSGQSPSSHEVGRRRSYRTSFDSACLPESFGGFRDSSAQFDTDLFTKKSLSL